MKRLLLAPGPTPVPDSVNAAIAQPIIHHRTPEFEAIFARVRDGLKWLYQTRQEVLTLAATGSGAMEAALVNLCSPQDAIVTINAGKFGERWTKIGKAYGLQVTEVFVERGRAVDLDRVKQAIRNTKGAKALFFQASETSTGSKLPTRELTALAQENGLLSVCDAITACGVYDLPMDAWGIDAMITGSQKALMLPPGLSFIALSEKAWKTSEQAKLPRFYFDLRKELKSQLKNQTAWTPAITLIIGAAEALRLMQAEGLQNLFNRHSTLARITREGVAALGLEVLSKDCPSESCTAVKVPGSIADGKQIPKLLRQKYAMTITGGQDELEGKIFRLSHFGYVTESEVREGLSRLKLALEELGYRRGAP